MNITEMNANIRGYIIFKNIDHAVHTALFRGRIIWSYLQFKDSGIVRSNTNWTIGIHCNYGHCLPRKSKKSSVEEFAILWWVAKYTWSPWTDVAIKQTWPAGIGQPCIMDRPLCSYPPANNFIVYFVDQHLCRYMQIRSVAIFRTLVTKKREGKNAVSFYKDHKLTSEIHTICFKYYTWRINRYRMGGLSWVPRMHSCNDIVRHMGRHCEKKTKTVSFYKDQKFTTNIVEKSEKYYTCWIFP